MKNKTLMLYAFIIMLCFCFAQCKKTKDIPKTELEKLPPITQTGANTFGCLVDGVAWLPNGTKPQNGGPNIQVYVDPTFQGGRFNVTGHQYNGLDSDLGFGSGTCTSSGTYNIDNIRQVLSYYKRINNNTVCIYNSSDSGVYKSGFFVLTKYDLVNGIFSGTFDFIIKSQACGDTIRITNGRFDVKL